MNKKINWICNGISKDGCGNTKISQRQRLDLLILYYSCCRIIAIKLKKFDVQKLILSLPDFFADVNYLEEIRAQIPVLQQKRSDLYKLEMSSWSWSSLMVE